jgi:hypothetical protein
MKFFGPGTKKENKKVRPFSLMRKTRLIVRMFFPKGKTCGLVWVYGLHVFPEGENMWTEFRFLPGPHFLYGKVHCILCYRLSDFCQEKKITPHTSPTKSKPQNLQIWIKFCFLQITAGTSVSVHKTHSKMGKFWRKIKIRRTNELSTGEKSTIHDIGTLLSLWIRFI